MDEAGRYFHDYNVVFRDDIGTRVVGFTQVEGQNHVKAGTSHDEYSPEFCGPNEAEGTTIDRQLVVDGCAPVGRASSHIDGHDLDVDELLERQTNL